MKVLLGVTGSIAAYKALELARLLKRQGAEVRFVLTRSALEFVTPLSCQTLSGYEVYVDQFVLTTGIKHLTLCEWADILVVAPATANILGKAASGIGDDLLSTSLLSCQKPVLFVPAMDEGMWDNPIVKKNVAILKNNGFRFVDPVVGALASGKIGRGRFPSVAVIGKKIVSIIDKHRDLGGKKFLVTGGRTEEDIDPVRVVTNRSTGLMAAELIQAIFCRGGTVKAIVGEAACQLPDGMDITRVRTSAEMLDALKNDFSWCDCLIMAAAVGDYRPLDQSSIKIHDEKFELSLKKNIDLLKEITKEKGTRIVVGFSLETSDQLARAQHKMNKKNMDIVVFNTPAAIGAERAAVSMMKRNSEKEDLGDQTKWQIANRILDECILLMDSKACK
ncbi:MAG: bifunctional phosphopantothenoylcysteine decarboxylase/phosphopantothenate--cysteine ligase CoaBC [candidate division WOR-3 bacterium]|nr:MAG: bifunctional phosphopantothenoylcysteine decarboxylase/phosphopantothenate--cysteine ligase CoaBC [candidate division WOR-3 bacterium]